MIHKIKVTIMPLHYIIFLFCIILIKLNEKEVCIDHLMVFHVAHIILLLYPTYVYILIYYVLVSLWAYLSYYNIILLNINYIVNIIIVIIYI